jgi:regulator of cell morphogenesis and NO signaling
MTTHGHLLLRELANAGDSVRSALDRFGLDYCCDGEESLARAGARAGRDQAAIERWLGGIEGRPLDDWARRGVPELVDHIVRVVHPRTQRALDELATCAASFEGADAATRELRDATALLVSHATAHMNDEERRLFARACALAQARIGRGPFPATLGAIHEDRERLHEGHATTHEHLRRVRALARCVPDAAGRALHARVEAASRAVMEQIHLENNELIPLALGLEPERREAGGAPSD